MHKGKWVISLVRQDETSLNGIVATAPDQGACWRHAMEFACAMVAHNAGAHASVFKIGETEYFNLLGVID